MPTIVTADAGAKIKNSSQGTVADAVDVSGGYFVIDATANIPTWANVTGALCYCTGTSKFYQYNGSQWNEAQLGGGGGSLVDSNTVSAGSVAVLAVDTVNTTSNKLYLVTKYIKISDN